MTIHAMIQHDGTENAFLPELVFWGYRLLACTTGETPVLQTGKMPMLPKRARRPCSHKRARCPCSIRIWRCS